MEIEKHIQNLKDYIRIDKENINYDDKDDFTQDNPIEVGQAISNLLEEITETTRISSTIMTDFINKDVIPKSKVREFLKTKYVAFTEGDTEFPDDANEIKFVKYVKVEDIEKFLQEE